MKNILAYYQNIPLHIDPIAFAFGSFSVGWYSLMYVVAFIAIYLLLRWRIKYDIESGKFPISNFKFSNKSQFSIFKFKNLVFDFLLYALAGVLIGGRLGYIIFYNPAYYFNNPLAIISPYDFSTGKLIGIYGMSYHGGLVAVIIVAVIFSKINKINFWEWVDFVAPAIPAGYFFGRIGNFLNLELYGRITNNWLGMHFTLASGAGPFLRYPSQLGEALLEGLFLFIILWSARNKNNFIGSKLALYLVGYGFIRISIEFFREPDEQIGLIFSYFTLGQLLSFGMILAGITIYFHRKKLSSIIN